MNEIQTVAALKRALTPGTAIRVVNHIRPEASRDTNVTHKTNTVDLVTYATNRNGERVHSHLRWPKASDLRPAGPGQVHIDMDGKPFLTLTILEGE